MSARANLFAMALVALIVSVVPTRASGVAVTEQIAFATNRAQNLHRSAIYSVRAEGRGRRLVALPTPPASSVVRSRDGTRILLTRKADGVEALFVSRPSGTQAVRLTPPSFPEEYVSLSKSSFSPDGSTIAFTAATSCGYRCEREALYLVNVDGSDLRRAAFPGADPSWALDGRRLVFSDTGTSVLDVATGRIRQIARRGSYGAEWAPRGERIAYLVRRGGYGVLCFVQSDGSRRRCLLGRTAAKIVWAPDARRVAFQWQGEELIATVRADGEGFHVFRDINGAFPVAWSPDSRRIAFLTRNPRQIAVRSLARPSIRQRVTHEPPDTQFSDVRWRAGRISYVADRWSNDDEVAVVSAEGGFVRPLTENSVQDRQPDWSPGADTIVFTRDRGRYSAIRLIEADGGWDRALTDDGPWRDSAPAWSPDGLRIAFVRDRSLMIVNRDGTGLRAVPTGSLVPGELSWSPDGRHLAVSGPSDGLHVLATDGSSIRTRVPGIRTFEPAWSPDGTRILFGGSSRSHPNQRRGALYTIEPDGPDPPIVVLEDTAYGTGGGWSRDGARIVFSRTRSAWPPVTTLAVANADGSGERELTGELALEAQPAWSN